MNNSDPLLFYNWYKQRKSPEEEREKVRNELDLWKDVLNKWNFNHQIKPTEGDIEDFVLFLNLYSEWYIMRAQVECPEDEPLKERINGLQKICFSVGDSIFSGDEDFFLSPLGVVYYKVVNPSKLRELKINKILK
jgi:hypothetical protein